MLTNVFRPQAPKGSYLLAIPTNASQAAQLPDGAENIVFYNAGSIDVFIEFGTDSSVVAVVPTGITPATGGGYPIRAGAKENIQLPAVGGPGSGNLATWIAYICAAAGYTGALYMTRGSGA